MMDNIIIAALWIILLGGCFIGSMHR